MDQAIEYGELSLRKAPTRGDEAWARRSLGWALCRSGESKKGIEHLKIALPVFQAGRFIPSEIELMCYLGEGYWLAGEDGKAKRTLEDCLEMTARCGTRYYLGSAHRFLGEIALKNNTSEALPHFEKSIDVLREIKAQNELALTYAGYGRLRKQQGAIDQARNYLTMALEIFEQLGTRIEPEKVREELAGMRSD